MVSNRSDSVVDSHEVDIFRNLGDDFACMVPLGLSCYHCDIHEALLWGGVHPVGDWIWSLIEVSDGESFSETSLSFGSLPVAVALSVLVFHSLVWRCVG
jgi:hypothetical protein